MARRAPPILWLLGALVPVGVGLAWRLLPFPQPAGLADCASLFSAPAVWRVAQAMAVIGALGIVAWLLGADRTSLSLRWPSRPVTVAALVFAAIVAPLALWLGPILAVPFFGEVRLETGMLGAIVPAVVLALANGLTQELTFRGALLGWSERAIGSTGALVFQAVVFGLVHVGPDFTGNPLPVLAAVGIGGLIAGVIVRRTGSLLLPIAVHAAFDVPLYYVQACRLT
ncbi:MAG: CPBP family intramembrane glutamic endopeptidase [Candidatus Limnocylindrales bacterium]